ncbi:holo-ACP synthase [Paenibacillus sp. F6_3S_P_1C]|uniref:Holo-[acyl-carrier-protein] synthase n=1 Tax=Paenibacillus vandeheii TaxID=3035917 RepID=A0ABT8JCH1_9BACL|nr:holo-ACP synthase [Paenibacillus vandeheii]MDN4602798.1 holo-ACP synthase [Paenibacillus vandeheii]
MIYGIGNDVLEIGRMRKLMSGRHAEAFMKRILTHAEREIADRRGKRRVEFVSGRFAAKEAVSKAFGCGIGSVMSFTDIEVLPDEKGRPVATLSAEAWERLQLPYGQQYDIHLSITHQTELAAAFAIVEQTEKTLPGSEQ